MEFSRKLDNGKVMTLCIHCERISHTYAGKCTCCGGSKEYDFFFKLGEKDRDKLLQTLNDLQKQK